MILYILSTFQIQSMKENGQYNIIEIESIR